MRIQAVMFNETIKHFEKMLHKGNFYYVSNAIIKEASEKYNSGSTKYEIIIDKRSRPIESNDFEFRNPMKFNFVYLNALHAYITGDKLIGIYQKINYYLFIFFNLIFLLFSRCYCCSYCNRRSDHCH